MLTSTKHNIDLQKFETEYARLNIEQKQAVDAIEGPVMVIAGAGTGKTQTIALRIANILLKTQTPAGSILCLTFTENAAINMRQRLLEIIGRQAYSIRIHTFHSFCNDVITQNPEHFIFAAEIEALDELEKIEIIQNLIENLPNGAQLKPWGDHFYYQREIISRLQTLKRENIDPGRLQQLIDAQNYFLNQSSDLFAHLKSLRSGKDLENQVLTIIDNFLQIPDLPLTISTYLKLNLKLFRQGEFIVGKAKNPVVNLKNELLRFYERLVKSTPKQQELHLIYSGYQQELKSRGRYDFEDMILFVLNAFKSDTDLLLQYQERYQYILVDEYQDTNSSQNQILDLLGSYFDIPNLFVVGDDDQSIFRFQGAAIENIFDFYQKYKQNLKLIVLKNNYRSHQLILDSSLSVIANNKNRITNYVKDIDKSLKSVQTYDPDPINLFAAPGELAENYYIGSKIQDLIKAGVSPNQIAVLYRNNSDVNGLTEILDRLSVGYRLETGDDVLDNSHIRQLIVLLNYLHNPGDDNLLFRLLNFPFLKINSIDLFKLMRYVSRQQMSLSEVVTDHAQLENLTGLLKPITIKRLNNFRLRLAKAQRWQKIYNLDKFFNRTIRRFGFLKYLMGLNDINEINCLNQFYSELKTLSLEKKISLEDFLRRLELLTQNKLPLVTPPLDTDYSDAVRLMTVHKAKGLEFDHVFLLRVLDKKWGNNVVSSSLSLPLGILKTELSLLTSQDDNEDERRLFYVALTRAKKQLYLAYPSKTDAGRELLPSMFVSEINPGLIQKIDPPKNISADALKALFPSDLPSPIRGSDMSQFIRHYIKSNYRFNVSHLNSYLKCPLCFYYKTILRVPSAKDKYASLGTAAHAALSYLFNVLKNKNQLITRQELLNVFERLLNRENLSRKNFEETRDRGVAALSAYYDHYQHQFTCNCLLDYDFAPDNVFLDNIPVTGKIDKVEILSTRTDGNPDINVVDFKTGNPDSQSAQLKLGADYFRQLVFYKILSDLDPHFKYHVVSGTIDFIQPSSRTRAFVKKDYKITNQDEDEIKQLIKDVYQKILNLEFSPSPDCPDTDDLHNLNKT